MGIRTIIIVIIIIIIIIGIIFASKYSYQMLYFLLQGLLPTPQMTSVIQTITNNNICHPRYFGSHYQGNRADLLTPSANKQSRRHGNQNDLDRRRMIGNRSNADSGPLVFISRHHGDRFDTLPRRDGAGKSRFHGYL